MLIRSKRALWPNAEARHWLVGRAASSQLTVQISSSVSNWSGESQLSCAVWLSNSISQSYFLSNSLTSALG
jgi:hypothetical protein